MLEPTYTSVEVMAVLHGDGIRACRERVNSTADAMFGRDKAQTYRRITVPQASLLREAFHMIDVVGLPPPTGNRDVCGP